MDIILLEIWGTPLSLLEACAIVASCFCLLFAVYENIATFPFGLLCTSLYCVFFYQHQLYSSMLLQVVFFGFNIFGYYQWTHPKIAGQSQLAMSWGSQKDRYIWLLTIVLISITLGVLANNFSEWGLGEAAQYPYLDALVTALSLVAQYLISTKKIENWLLWIIVDILACILYAISNAPFTAILYFGFIILAVKGWLEWKKKILVTTQHP